MKTIKELREAAGRKITVNWEPNNVDHGKINQDKDADFAAMGIEINDYDKKSITVSGTEKDLMKWLQTIHGMNKRGANMAMQKGKKVKV